MTQIYNLSAKVLVEELRTELHKLRQMLRLAKSFLLIVNILETLNTYLPTYKVLRSIYFRMTTLPFTR